MQRHARDSIENCQMRTSDEKNSIARRSEERPDDARFYNDSTHWRLSMIESDMCRAITSVPRVAIIIAVSVNKRFSSEC